MNNYLAKSNPRETIIEHTENLLNNYEILKTIYPNLKVDWDILYYACLFHDLGKMNRKFQDKIERIKIHDEEIPHGILSLAFIDYEFLEEEGYNDSEIRMLFHSIAYHHERKFEFTDSSLEAELEIMREEFENFSYDRIDNIEYNEVIEDAFFFKNDRIDESDEELFLRYTLIKGLLNRLDYAASGHIDVELENDFLLESLEVNLLDLFRKKDKNANWNNLQNYMINNRENNVVVTAQTGMGKTEAGLLWIGNNKGFFTLPLKTAINAMYTRIVEKIVIDDYENKVGLLHSDIKREYLYRIEENSKTAEHKEINFDEYYDRTKQLSLPLTVCTIDQIFGFVYRYRGFEPILATLSYSKIVIDEVQMYSPDLLAYLVIGLSYINKVGGKFAILTATLPPVFVDLLKKENLEFKEEVFTNKKIRHSLKVINDKLDIKFIKEQYNNNKILVICNTVNEAQRVYKELSEDENIAKEINLFHSGYIKKDRKFKEDNILEFGKKENKEKGIWIATQVVEASLDIDFDILITELSDLNGLFQRMGRCYRSRDWDSEGYNCYVYDGGDLKTSGIGYVIDEDIFEFSKQALREIDGVLMEEDKIKLINNVYTTENLKNSEYYKKIITNIEYVGLIEANEKLKSDVKKIFRNIESKNVIPGSVYEENEELIEEIINTLNTDYGKTMSVEEKKQLKRNKLKARLKLEDLEVSVPLNRIERGQIKITEINKYEYIEIFDCIYNKETGIEYIKVEKADKKTVDDKFI